MATPGLIKYSFKYVDESQKILRRFEKQKVRRMNRAGSLVRTIMRRSIRFRTNKKSQPGGVPFAHTRGFGLRTIFYSYDRSTDSVVIGPVVGPDKTGAPQALEFGGFSFVRLSRRQRMKTGKRRVRAKIRKRSFSFPALRKAATKYPEVYKGLF